MVGGYGLSISVWASEDDLIPVGWCTVINTGSIRGSCAVRWHDQNCYDGSVGWRRNHSDNSIATASTIDATTTMDIYSVP